MLTQNQYDRDMIATFFHYLHEAMNTTKQTIRVNGESKPREIVVSVLSKLEYFDFLYAVEKYKENTSKVNNQGAYIITLLYNARAQHEADITKKVHCALPGAYKGMGKSHVWTSVGSACYASLCFRAEWSIRQKMYIAI